MDCSRYSIAIVCEASGQSRFGDCGFELSRDAIVLKVTIPVE